MEYDGKKISKFDSNFPDMLANCTLFSQTKRWALHMQKYPEQEMMLIR